MIPPIYTVHGVKHNSLRCHGTVYNSDTLERAEKVDKITTGAPLIMIIIREKLIKNQSWCRWANTLSEIENLSSYWSFILSIMGHIKEKFTKGFESPSWLKKLRFREKYSFTPKMLRRNFWCTVPRKEKNYTADVKCLERSVVDILTLTCTELGRSVITATDFASLKVVDVKNCSSLLSCRIPGLQCRIYADLFPYGYGHLNSKRKLRDLFNSAVLAIWICLILDSRIIRRSLAMYSTKFLD